MLTKAQDKIIQQLSDDSRQTLQVLLKLIKLMRKGEAQTRDVVSQKTFVCVKCR